MRRFIVFLFAMVFVLGQAASWGQIDPLPPEAKQAADKLIGLLDAGKYQETYDMISPIVTDTPALWHGHMKSWRDPMGGVKVRALAKSESVTRFADLPKGNYTQVTFHTEFATQAEASEVVVLHQSEDGNWGVVGYEVQFNRWPEALKMMGIGLFIVFFIMVLLATITWAVGKLLHRTAKNAQAKKEG